MSVQRVVVTRTGGFAGIVVTREVDDPSEAERLTAAVRSAASQDAGRARDDFVYEFTIVTTVGIERVDLTGAQLTDDLRPAVRSLLA
ncbi:protealysin inhibitor emfourin [uncultured Amnibacterium sp.]|uniref:protealysin inhibitor emfourin n=1 Tax=uncultured Amnibacterium sp. TaxID=1631851 RepID=UPI0035C954CA